MPSVISAHVSDLYVFLESGGQEVRVDDGTEIMLTAERYGSGEGIACKVVVDGKLVAPPMLIDIDGVDRLDEFVFDSYTNYRTSAPLGPWRVELVATYSNAQPRLTDSQLQCRVVESIAHVYLNITCKLVHLHALSYNLDDPPWWTKHSFIT